MDKIRMLEISVEFLEGIRDLKKKFKLSQGEMIIMMDGIACASIASTDNSDMDKIKFMGHLNEQRYISLIRMLELDKEKMEKGEIKI